MEHEPRPGSEPGVRRFGVPAVTAVLTAIVCATVLTLDQGPTRIAIVVVALVTALALGFAQRRRRGGPGRPFDGPALAQYFAMLWAWWVGVPEVLPFLGTDGSPGARVLSGLMVAVIATALLWLAFRPLRSSASR